MSIKVRMSPLLARYIKSQPSMEAYGGTVGECLKNLEGQFSKLRLFEKNGSLLSYLIISVNKEIVPPEELFTKLVKDGDELSVMLMIAGG
jgi:sulfur carrier protein ThiS